MGIDPERSLKDFDMGYPCDYNPGYAPNHSYSVHPLLDFTGLPVGSAKGDC